MRRVLIDECIHPRLTDRLRSQLPAMVVDSVRDVGWSGYSDRALVALMNGRYDVFVTLDQGFEFQHIFQT